MKTEEAKIEELKVGDTYNVRVKVVDIDDDTDEIITETVNENGYSLGFEWCYYAPGEALAFSPITTPPTPQYDPCRIFQRGDKVRVKREVNGRPVYIGEDAWDPLDPEEIWTVVEEKDTGWVKLKNGCFSADVWHGMLELVTPVDELEPYSVGESTDYFSVDDKEGEELSIYWKNKHPHAEKSAEAECDRLNAAYRKESQK